MTRTAFLKKYFLRFAVALTLLSLIVYVLYHVFGSSADRLMRTPVRMITDEQILSAQAYLFRDESLLTVEEEGFVNDLAESGTKVSRDMPVAEVWKGSEAWSEAAQARLDSLNRVIAVLEESRVTLDTPLSQTEVYQSEILNRYLDICQSVHADNWSQIASLEDEMLTYLNRYAALTGSREELDAALTACREERAALLGELLVTVSNNGETSGYFYDRNCVDGYEDLFTVEALQGLTADGFFDLIAAEPEATEAFAVGKMAYGYEWYLAIAFDAGAEEWFSDERGYTFRLPDSNGMSLKMTCQRVMKHTDGRVVAIFASADHPAELRYLRSQRVEITVESNEGYYVPESALRTVDGVEGVYIFKDSTVYFRRIEVLYRGDGYCIAAEQNGREGYLALYDLLVTSGENLYDGRVFQ